MELTKRQRIISSIMKIIIFVSAVVGTILSAYAGRGTFMGGNRVFMYFTIQSNIALALVSAVGLIYIHRKNKINNVWYIIRFVAAVSITLTGAVFCFVLAPTMGPYAWNIQNILTHVVVPVVSVVDFFITGVNSDIKKKYVLLVTLPPLAYAIYASIGYVSGWQFSENTNYPYFFLNWGSKAGAFGFTNELPFMGSAWWILALLILLICVGYAYLVILDKLKKNK